MDDGYRIEKKERCGREQFRLQKKCWLGFWLTVTEISADGYPELWYYSIDEVNEFYKKLTTPIKIGFIKPKPNS